MDSYTVISTIWWIIVKNLLWGSIIEFNEFSVYYSEIILPNKPINIVYKRKTCLKYFWALKTFILYKMFL